MNNQENFANQKADWDLCEKHVLATGTYKVLDVDPSNVEKCECCGQIIPREELYFSTCDSSIEFGKLGAPGFPLLLKLHEYVCCLWFLLTIVYFIPMIALWYQAYEPVADGAELDPEFSYIGMFSVGLFTYDPITEDGIRLFETGESADKVEEIGLYLTLGLILLFISLVCVRRSLMNLAIELDKDAYT